jgi:hypothetical protein
VGSAPRYEGVLPELFHRHDAPWWLSRPFVAAALLAAVACPLLVPRSLTAVAKCSRLSVVMVSMLAATICGLAVAAVAQGKAADVHFWPPCLDGSTEAAGDGGSGGAWLLFRNSVTVVSVACLSMTIHFVLLPVVGLRALGCCAVGWLAAVRRQLQRCQGGTLGCIVWVYARQAQQTGGGDVMNEVFVMNAF